MSLIEHVAVDRAFALEFVSGLIELNHRGNPYLLKAPHSSRLRQTGELPYLLDGALHIIGHHVEHVRVDILPEGCIGVAALHTGGGSGTRGRGHNNRQLVFRQEPQLRPVLTGIAGRVLGILGEDRKGLVRLQVIGLLDLLAFHSA